MLKSPMVRRAPMPEGCCRSAARRWGAGQQPDHIRIAGKPAQWAGDDGLVKLDAGGAQSGKGSRHVAKGGKVNTKEGAWMKPIRRCPKLIRRSTAALAPASLSKSNHG